MQTTPKIKGAYLNYSSTNAKKSGIFNPSDAYPSNKKMRDGFTVFVDRICTIVHAPIGSQVIINSGSTESISNCVFWARKYNKFGTIVGSEFDHKSIEENTKIHDMNYVQLDKLHDYELNDNTSMIFITHVNSKTGEIFDVESFTNELQKYEYLYEDNTHFTSDFILQYRPLLVLDVAQSIMKIPIDMEKWNINALFFSLHKLGGPIGFGVFIIAPTHDKIPKFTPLIAGSQQGSLRGGTWSLKTIAEMDLNSMFSKPDNPNKRKKIWEETKKYFEDNGLNVYTPKYKHLYNTFLIDTKDKCSLALIEMLAQRKIYVGNISACESELNSNENHYIRISFRNPKELNMKVIEIIKNLLKKELNIE